MNNLTQILCDPDNPIKSLIKISNYLNKKNWIQLIYSKDEIKEIPINLFPKGPGIILHSGGSSGGPNLCLQSFENLDKSAYATSLWLKDQGIEPAKCLIINPLPIHHISGIMPWWRSHKWGAKHIKISPHSMRNSNVLERKYGELIKENSRKSIISLVPIQLHRLLNNSTGITWLKKFTIIFVGGSSLSKEIANKARQENLPLAPCYGSTETASMITILKPSDFLRGEESCGEALIDVQIRINRIGAIEVKSSRLSQGILKSNYIKNIFDNNGWWESGDIGEIENSCSKKKLRILGRLDTAIHSGGETIFPEILENKLKAASKKENIPIKNLVFLGLEDKDWGSKLVGLICFEDHPSKKEYEKYIYKVKDIIKNWHPSQKAKEWYVCEELDTNDAGKLERSKWVNWVKDKKKL